VIGSIRIASCGAAGSSAAAFTGTVLGIVNAPPPIVPPGASPTQTGRIPAGRFAGNPPLPHRPLRAIRIRIGEVLSGVEPSQQEIEILTGVGGGDCGYPFQTGADYVVYAYKNSDGHLETGICSRTRPLAQAADDVAYFHSMASASSTGTLRVQTGFPGRSGMRGVGIIAEQGGSRYRSLTNDAGEAVFVDLPAGNYRIHAESDGDLPDDPGVQLGSKGCASLTLFRALRLVGRVTTPSGEPAGRIEVQFRSMQDSRGDGVMTDRNGRYEIRIVRPGQYYLGVNLNHTPSRDTPYPRWFYPGTADPASATAIDFSGKPETRTFDFTLPEQQSRRTIEGFVATRDGQARPRAVVMVLDDSRNVIAQAFADVKGFFSLDVFSGTSYRLHAVWPGNTPGDAVSAVPIDIAPGTDELSLRIELTLPGNSFLEAHQKGASTRR
jgi:Carboxypeptidase regulatory-like domain